MTGLIFNTESTKTPCIKESMKRSGSHSTGVPQALCCALQGKGVAGGEGIGMLGRLRKGIIASATPDLCLGGTTSRCCSYGRRA